MSIPRNQPCACGSGKKFKKCCWNPKHKTLREMMVEAAPQAAAAIEKIKERETIAKRTMKRSPMAAMMLLGLAASMGMSPSRR